VFVGGGGGRKKLNKKVGELLNLNRNQRLMTGLLTEYYNLKGHLLKLVPVKSPECDRCEQASEMILHMLCHCEALATLRYSHLGHHFMKIGDFEDISVSKILHFALGARLENDSGKGLHKRSCPLFYILQVF
jgi:hypothetical protein